MSRKWRTRSYLRQCGLVIIDEIHLLGADRGPVLEVIVSRLRSMSASTSSPIRIVGLSTSLANPDDVVDWLNIDPRAVYNFHPVVRPTSLSVHIAGSFPKVICWFRILNVLLRLPRFATLLPANADA